MKKIFTLVFLCGMLYTVFNYLPVIEEEVSSKKHEQTSKPQPDPDNTDPDEESESSHEDIFSSPRQLCEEPVLFPANFRHYLWRSYLPPLREHSTPPPRPQV